MAEHQATRLQAAASAPTHQANENKDLGKAADVNKVPPAVTVAPATPEGPGKLAPAQKKELATLQERYDDLKAKSERNARTRKDNGEVLADKGDAFRELDAFKRKHGLA